MVKSVVVVALAVMAAVFAPLARAERTVTVAQACSELLPGSVPVQLSSEVSCQDPQIATRGPWTKPLPTEMALVFPGSYRANPADQWSDWVIP